jgi:hypothetical protein
MNKVSDLPTARDYKGNHRHDGGWLLEPGGGILKDDRFPASHPPPHHTPCIAESGMSFSQPTIYLFQCSNNQRRYGATPDKAGTNLPALGCPGGKWTPHSQTILAPTPQSRISLDENELRAGLSKQGFYLWDSNITAADFSDQP